MTGASAVLTAGAFCVVRKYFRKKKTGRRFYITIDSTEKYVLVTHFSVGEPVRVVERTDHGYKSRLQGNDSPTCLYRLDDKTGLGELLDVGIHKPEHGFMTMIHKAYESPDHTFFVENDLGDNQVYFFRIENEKLCYISRAAVVEELELLEPGETLKEEDNQSEIMFSPDGKFLYNFMRGKGIADVIEIDGGDGSMKLRQKFSLPGNDPRGAQYSPDGRHILIEGHNSGMVYTLDIQEDGTLCYREKACAMAHPECIAFYRNKQL